jgi:hypothetical protein
VCFKPVAVSTEGLQVGWVIVKAITVYVVYIQLADVHWLEVTVFAVVLTVSVIRRTGFHLIDLVDSLTTVPT